MALEGTESEQYHVKFMDFKARCERLELLGIPFNKLSRTILEVVSLLTPDDVRQIDAIGFGNELRRILGRLGRNFDTWRSSGYILQQWVVGRFWDKLYEFEAVLREGVAAKYASKVLSELGTVEELEGKRDVDGLISIIVFGETRRDAGAAAEALGRLKDKRAVEPLIEAIHDRYFGLTPAAIAALGQIEDRRAVEPLVEVLGTNLDSLAMEALCEIWGEEAG